MERVAHVEAAGFIFCFLNGPLQYVHRITKLNVLSALSEMFPSFLMLFYTINISDNLIAITF